MILVPIKWLMKQIGIAILAGLFLFKIASTTVNDDMEHSPSSSPSSLRFLLQQVTTIKVINTIVWMTESPAIKLGFFDMSKVQDLVVLVVGRGQCWGDWWTFGVCNDGENGETDFWRLAGMVRIQEKRVRNNKKLKKKKKVSTCEFPHQHQCGCGFLRL